MSGKRGNTVRGGLPAHPVSTTGRTARISSSTRSRCSSAAGVLKTSGQSLLAAWR